MWAALLASTASSPPPVWQWLTSTVTDGRFCFFGGYFGYCTVHQEDGQLCSSQYVSHTITLNLFCSPCPIIWSVLLYSPLSLVKAEVLLLCYCVARLGQSKQFTAQATGDLGHDKRKVRSWRGKISAGRSILSGSSRSGAQKAETIYREAGEDRAVGGGKSGAGRGASVELVTVWLQRTGYRCAD